MTQIFGTQTDFYISSTTFEANLPEWTGRYTPNDALAELDKLIAFANEAKAAITALALRELTGVGEIIDIRPCTAPSNIIFHIWHDQPFAPCIELVSEDTTHHDHNHS